MLTEKELAEIRRKMLELDEDPPVAGWQKIQGDIRPRRRWLPYWWGLGAALMLGVGGGVYYLQQHKVGDAALPRPIEIARTSPAPGAASAEQGILPNPGDKEATEAISNAPVPNSDTAAEPIASNTQKENKPAREGKPSVVAPAQEAPKVASTERAVPAGKNSARTNPLVFRHEEKNTTSNGIENEKSRNREKLQAVAADRQAAVAPKAEKEEQAVADNANAQQAPISVAKPDKDTTGEADSIGQEPDSNPITATQTPASPKEATQATTVRLAEENAEMGGKGTPGQDSVSEANAALKPNTAVLQESQPIALETDSLQTDEKAEEEAVAEAPPVIDIEKAKKWSIGVYFAPRFAYRAVNPKGEDQVLVTQMNNSNRSGNERVGYELGMSVLRDISSRLSLESNLGILTHQEALAYTYSTGQVDHYEKTVVDGEINLNPVLVMQDRQLNSTAAFGNLRLAANWYFWQNNYRQFHMSVGGGANLLLRSKTEQYLNGQLVAEDSEGVLRKSNYHLMLGLGYNRRFLEHFTLTAMPMVQYFLASSFSEAEHLGVKPYSVGVHLQLRRRSF